MDHHGAAMCMLLLVLPDDLLFHIICLLLPDDFGIQYDRLRKICRDFRRICDEPAVMRRMSLRVLRDYCLPERPGLRNPYLYACFEERFRLVEHPESLCYDGMNILMTQPSTEGLKLVERAADAGYSIAAYFMAMSWYRSNPADPKALAHCQRICGGPSPSDGRWVNHAMDVRHKVAKDLRFFAYEHWLPPCYDPPSLLVQDPHVCIWAKCRRYGNDGRLIIRYCSPECRIRHEFDLWTRVLEDRVKRAISNIMM